MSLAMFAAPFDDNIESNNQDNNIMNKKRRAHSRTQKMYPKESFDTNKVNSVLEKIHNNLDSDDDIDAFNPPPKAVSSGVQRTIPEKTSPESMMNMTNNNDLMFRTLGRAPQPNYEGCDNLDLNDYKLYGDSKSVDEYYKKLLPGYNPNKNPVNRPYHSANYSGMGQMYTDNSSLSSQDILLQKLNYMINLLEEQQDERTNNVTEEVVLYSFLGIFIIFVVDSFARVGKYVR